jgi:hypothetical protein
MPPKKLRGQLEFNLEEQPPRIIPKKYDEQRALKARRRRNTRLGGLIINDVTKGFMSLDKGLWIPASKSEITYSIDGPKLAMNKSKLMIYEKTHHKGYARKAANVVRKKIETFYVDANEQRWKLTRSLLHNPERSFTEYTVTNSELAIEALVRYVQDLNSFIERDWPQRRWGRYKENTSKAQKEVNALYSDDLLDLYDEAFWSVRSRMRFWHIRGMNANDPPQPPPTPFNTPDPEEIDYEAEYTGS